MGTLSLIQNDYSSSGILRFIILTFLAMKDTYGKTSTGMTKFTKGVTKRFNNAGANLSRVGSNLISSNKKKNDVSLTFRKMGDIFDLEHLKCEIHIKIWFINYVKMLQSHILPTFKCVSEHRSRLLRSLK